MGKPSPFNGKWGLIYASDFEALMEDWEIVEDFRPKVRTCLKDYGPTRLTEEYYIDNDAGTISRSVTYQQVPERKSGTVPFETIVTGTYFDGRPTKSYFGREGGRDNMIVRFEIGNYDQLHFMIVTEVNGDIMTSTYTVRGKTFIKKFERIR